MTSKAFLILASLSILIQAGCSAPDPNYANGRGAPGGASTTTPQPAELNNALTRLPPATLPANADLVLGPEMNGEKFTVFVGQTISVSLPIEAQKSTVEFDPHLLTALPPDLPSEPGPASWFFQATQTGATELRIVMDAAPLPMYEFVVHLTVQARP